MLPRDPSGPTDPLVVELRQGGPLGAPELCARLGLSQPVFSRRVKLRRDSILTAGKARATRYAARRSIEGVGDRAPIYEVSDRGTIRRVAVLHAVAPQGFYVEALVDDLQGGFFADLPYFLDGLRPDGFLGRRVPMQHPELNVPADVRHWSADHCLRYFAHLGWDLPGSFIVGDDALHRFQRHATEPPEVVPEAGRAAAYPRLAGRALGDVPAGSSAGGEHPKFLAWRDPGAAAVLVKFSPPRSGDVSRRIADLLVCEHLAHITLAAHGRPRVRSELVLAEARVFLEVERFDRLPDAGRRGVVSLLALDAEFLGRFRSWSDSAQELAAMGAIPDSSVIDVRWLELFGQLIANSDMHHGNLSFFTQGTQVLSVAPAYDMLPMLYVPVAGELSERRFEPPLPSSDDAPIFAAVVAAALDFWSAVAVHSQITPEFREIAAGNAERVAAALRRFDPPG